jgi:hypothetical protein
MTTFLIGLAIGVILFLLITAIEFVIYIVMVLICAGIFMAIIDFFK